MSKITIIGAGFIGTEIANLLMMKNYDNIILIDINEDLAIGKAIDLSQSKSIFNSDSKIIGTSSYTNIEKSDIIIITAGISRKPGMSREDLININSKIIREISSNIKKNVTNEPIVIVISNPIDLMVYLTYKNLGFDKSKIIGMAGILDTNRMKYFVSEKLNVSMNDVSGFVLGSHGDLMVPIISSIKVKHNYLRDIISDNELNEIIDKTKNGGGQIIDLLKTQSAFISPASSVFEMIESIIKNKKKVLSCLAFMNGEYGISDIFLGVPCEISKTGVSKIIQLNLEKDEKENLNYCINHIKKLIDEN